jgi:hypothetical protein
LRAKPSEPNAKTQQNQVSPIIRQPEFSKCAYPQIAPKFRNGPYRGNRIFYRRAMLACNNTKWRQIEFEYPAWEKRRFDSFVTRTSFALRAYKELGC